MRVDQRSWLLRRAFPITVITLLLFTFLTVGFTYQSSSRLLRESLNDANQAALREIVARIDASFDVVDHLLVATASDPDVRGYFSMNYPDLPSYLTEASRVQLQLASIRRTVPILNSIMLTNFRHGEILTHATSMPLGDYPDQSIIGLVRSSGVDGSIIGPVETRHPSGHLAITEDVLFVVRPYPLGVSGELATGGLIATMQVSSLQSQVSRYARELGLSVSATAPDGRLVVDASASKATEQVAWVSDPVLSGSTGLVFEASAAAESTLLGIRKFRTLVIVVALGGVIMACLVALFLDRGLRRPWEETVLAIASDVEESTHPSEDAADRTVWSLPAIRRDVHDLIERTRELEDRFETSRDSMLQQVLASRLLNPSFSGTDDELVAQIGIAGPLYQVLLLDIGRQRSTRASTPSEDALISLAERSFDRLGPSRAVLLPDGMLAVVVCPSVETAISRRARGVAIALRQEGFRDAAVAIGDIHSGHAAMHSSYVEATFALEFRVVRPDAPVITYSDVSANAAPLLPRDASDRLARLRDTMHTRSAQDLRHWADEFLDCVEETCKVPVALKHALARFVTDASQIAARMRIETAGTAPDFHHALWAGRNRDEVEGAFHRAVDWFAEALANAGTTGVAERRSRELVEKVDELLLDRTLSLTLVADSVGASNAHVSRMFRQATGKTFQAYVAAGRAGKAERLLRESHEPVKEIAVSVGYTEVHTLIRVFKRHYGVTPAEYRRGARADATV